MKERPILFSAPMVRAILEDRKTQTRRVVRPQPPRTMLNPTDIAQDSLAPSGYSFTSDEYGDIPLTCPYGQPGDRLWVRESWCPDPVADGTWNYTSWAGCREGQIAGVPSRFRHPRFCNYAADWLHEPIRWTPSSHMPRWASRITLEVTGVRVERLRDISRMDCLAEGWEPDQKQRQGVEQGEDYIDDAAIEWYADLWQSINGPGSWDANPWVWVVEFKPLPEPPK